MIVWIGTDMEGLAGVDNWQQCYAEDDDAPEYLYGREQLTAEVNAAVAGCFDAGATEVRVLDGHGRNRNRGFIPEKLDPRVRQVGIESRNPLRWEGLDESVHALAIIGQHAMAGTLNGFLDHTQWPKMLCRFLINRQDHGEMSMLALYAGYYGVPLLYVSGDEALCDEARHLFPGVVSTPTKRGTGWETCELYPPSEVRENIRRDLAAALRAPQRPSPWRVSTPIALACEWAYSALADRSRSTPAARRISARIVSWEIEDPREIFDWP